MFAQFVAMVRCQGPAALRHRSTTLVRVKKDFIECMLMAVIHEKLLSQLEAAGVCVTPQIRVRTAPGRRMTGPVEGDRRVQTSCPSDMRRLRAPDNGHVDLPNLRNRLLAPRLNLSDGWDLVLCCFQPESICKAAKLNFISFSSAWRSENKYREEFSSNTLQLAH